MVTGALAHPGNGIAPDGLWQAGGPLTLPRPGTWALTQRVLIPDANSVSVHDSVQIAP